MHAETGVLAAGAQRSLANFSTNLEGSQLSFSYHQSLRDLEHDVPTEILPGTEIMGDIGDYHLTKRGRNNTVLVPQPSNDPNDPLVSRSSHRRTVRTFLRTDNHRIGAHYGSYLPWRLLQL